MISPSVDAQRDKFHVNYISPDDLSDRLIAQAYRPEIIQALATITASGMECLTLADICDGQIRQGRTPVYADEGTPCLKTQNIETILVSGEPAAFVDAAFISESPDSYIRMNTVLMNRSGAGSIGRCGVYLGREAVATNEHLLRFTVSPSHDPAYLACYLSTWWGQRAIEQRINGSTGQLQLNQSEIRELLVPCATYEIQRAIGNKVRKAQRLRELASVWRSETTTTIQGLFGDFLPRNDSLLSWVDRHQVSPERIDSWFHKQAYLQLEDYLGSRSDFVRIAELARVVSSVVRWSNWSSDSFFYFEIGDLSSGSGSIVPTALSVTSAPSRAKYVVRALDLLVSTVRPNRKGIALVSPGTTVAVASSGFCVLRAESGSLAGYLWACLKHDVSTMQMMRFNTGAMYPAIERTVPSHVRIPWPGREIAEQIGQGVLEALSANREAGELVAAAQRDIDALLNGTLDTDLLLEESGKAEVWLVTNSSSPAGGAR